MRFGWRFHEYGEPGEVLRFEQSPDIHPGSNEIRVRVAATSLNFADVLLCRGRYQHKPDLPCTPGLEVCGIVEQVGEGVDPAALGSRVVGQPVLPYGGFADHALLRHEQAYPVPTNIDDATAATLHLTYLTAWLGLHRRAGMRAGDVVVVTAAAGGVGSAAVQIARAAGATVVGIASGAAKTAAVARLGADHVIDRATDDVVASVRAFAPDGADIVFDSVGGEAYEWATKYIAFEGRIIVVGFASGAIPQPRLNHSFVKNYTIAGLHWTLYLRHRPELIDLAQKSLFEMTASGLLDPMITTRIAPREIPMALDTLAQGRTHGKIVVEWR